MIAHVAEAGEGRGRVVLHLTQGKVSPFALEAAIRVARAFQSELESLYVEDAKLLDIAGFPFAREISLSGRQSRQLSPEIVERQMRAAAAALLRKVRELAQAADVPLQSTVVRNEPMAALAEACSSRGPWNVVALAEPLSPADGSLLRRLFASVPGTTGLIVVGPTAKRATGRVVGVVEDIDYFEAVLRTARRLFEASDGARFTLLLVAESNAEAELMDEQARLVIGEDETIEIVRARVQANSPAMVAELIRKLDAGFIVGRFGGIVVPSEGDMRPLAGVLECPMFLIR
ncbi:MAG: hypothetical protein SFW09_21530 [Hyphomicrobiaceae bacterium]|nr:hypothetical protein [Hyphomicrobiaceae bacterium]